MDAYNKRSFWEALIIALFIFGIGILLGYLIEANRASKISNDFQASELNMLDIRAQSDLFLQKDVNCVIAVNETINFADRIYNEALLLEKYEGANKIGQEIIQQHKKYDVLRVILFANALNLKDKCKSSPDIILYFYEYQTQNLDTSALQDIFSNKLMEIKSQQKDKLLLIPIAGNIDSNSISYLRDVYNITSLPTILVNQKIKIENVNELATLGSLF